MFRESPKVMNQSMNRAFTGIGSAHLRRFAQKSLRKGIYNVRARGAARRRKGQPTVPAKVRAAGFKGVLTGAQSLERKRLSMRTSNPLIIQRDVTRAPILPRRAKHLVIRGDPSFRGRGAKQRRAAHEARGGGKVVLRRVKRVKVGPKVGFIDVWQNGLPDTRSRLAKAFKQAVSRIAGFRRRQAGSRGA